MDEQPDFNQPLAVYEPNAGQAAFHGTHCRYLLACSGVGGGKSAAGAMQLAYNIFGNAQARGRGEPLIYGVYAPTYDRLRKNTLPPIQKFWPKSWFAPEHRHSIDELLKLRKMDGPVSVILATGDKIDFMSAQDPESLRGPNLAGAWPDEGGIMKEAAFEEICNRVRVPCAISQVLVTTTPTGLNWLWRKWVSENPDSEQWKIVVWAATANEGHLVDGYFESRRKAMDPMLAKQDIDGEFINIGAFAWLNSGDVLAAADSTWTTGPGKHNGLYGGVDVGGKQDPTVIWTWADVGGRLVTVGYVRLERPSAPQNEAACREICGRPGMVKVCIDAQGPGQHLADMMEVEFGSVVEGVSFTNASKYVMASRLRLAYERRQVTIPPDQRVYDSMMAVQESTSDSGMRVLDAPRLRTGHADEFWAAALGLHATDDYVLCEESTEGSEIRSMDAVGDPDLTDDERAELEWTMA